MTPEPKNLNENRIYKQGYAYGKSGAVKSEYQPVKDKLPKTLQTIFELGRVDGRMDAARGERCNK